jgi:Spy/CpxP family protein refolding chaperone
MTKTNRILSVAMFGLSGLLLSGGARAAQPGPSGPVQAAQLEPAGDPNSFAQLVGEALGQLNLTESQKSAIGQAFHDVASQQASVSHAKRALMLAIADQIRSGHVDKNALKSEVDSYANAVGNATPAMLHALDKLHSILEPSQREQFASSIRQLANQHRSEYAAGRWIDDSYSPTSADEKQELDRLLDAFSGQQFSAEQVTSNRDIVSDARQDANRMIDMASKVNGVLTPEQRNREADVLRKAAPAQSAHPGSESIGSSQQRWVGYGWPGVYGGVYGWPGAYGAWGYPSMYGLGYGLGYGTLGYGVGYGTLGYGLGYGLGSYGLYW